MPDVPQYPPYPPAPFPEPPARKSYTTLIVLSIFFGLMILGVGTCTALARMSTSMKADSGKVGEAVLGLVRAGDYGALWDQAAPEFQKATPRDKLGDFLGSIEKVIGKPKSWTLVGVNKQVNFGSGSYTVYTFQVTHEHGSSTAIVTVNAQGKLLGLRFNMGS